MLYASVHFGRVFRPFSGFGTTSSGGRTRAIDNRDLLLSIYARRSIIPIGAQARPRIAMSSRFGIIGRVLDSAEFYLAPETFYG